MLNLYDNATAARVKPLRERFPGMSEDALALFLLSQDMHKEAMTRIDGLILGLDMLQAQFVEMSHYANGTETRAKDTRPASRQKSRAVSVGRGGNTPPTKQPGNAPRVRGTHGHVA